MNQTLQPSNLLIHLKESKEEIKYIPQNINLISNIEIKNSVISNYNIFLSNSYIPNYSNDDFIKIYKLYNNAQFLSLKKKTCKS